MRPSVPPPADAEDRRRRKPVICYPVDNLPQPDPAILGVARQGLTKIAELLVPPRDGRAFEVPQGHFFRILSIDGPEVGDLNLFNATDLSERFFSGKTRALHATHLTTGDRLWSTLPYLRPMATITYDTLGWYGWDADGGGVHDVNDIGGTLLATLDDTHGIVDLGDLPTDAIDTEGNCARITRAIAAILEAGAVPVVLGGDDSVPIPVLRAYEGRGPLTVVQVDGHVDWGDVIKGNPNGYGSTMRRAAEMPWVANMVQIGIGGLGSGTADQIVDARGWGSHIFTARDIRRVGIQQAINAIPMGADCIVTIDCDGLDPSLMPAVGMPTPGGIDYLDLLDLLHGVAKKGRIAGFFLMEFVPNKDPHGLAALIAARIVLTGIGLIRGAMTDGTIHKQTI